MALQATKTKLHLDGQWNLEELSNSMKSYIQLYGFAYSLLPDLPSARDREVDYIYGKFPWRGGYSTVNFFNQLFHNIPPKLRPQVERIQYSSPGFIELLEVLAAAAAIAKIVKAVCSVLNNVNDTYRKIQKGSTDHQLAKINLTKEKLDLTEKQIDFCKKSNKALIQAFDLTKEQEQLIDRRTGGNPVMKLKILLSVFRRVKPLAEKQSEGKLEVTGKKSNEAKGHRSGNARS